MPRRLNAAVASERVCARIAEVARARASIPSDKALAVELGLSSRTLKWLMWRAHRLMKRPCG